MRAFLSGALPLAALVSTQAACGQNAPSVDRPNPASVHCEELGGESEIRTELDGGQYGVCHLPDGRVCEEWALFREGVCESR